MYYISPNRNSRDLISPLNHHHHDNDQNEDEFRTSTPVDENVAAENDEHVEQSQSVDMDSYLESSQPETDRRDPSSFMPVNRGLDNLNSEEEDDLDDRASSQNMNETLQSLSEDDYDDGVDVGLM